MALKNKPGTFLERYFNQNNVKKHRKLLLKINYLKRLSIEFSKKYEAFMKKEAALIENYYQEDITPLIALRDGLTKNDQKRALKLKKFDEKAYWSRRKYKTSILKSDQKNDIDALLKAWDIKQADQRVQFEKQLDKNLPHQSINPVQLNKINKQIEALDVKKQKQLDAMEIKGQKLKSRTEQFLKRNQASIESKTNKNKSIMASIIKYNERRHEEDGKLLNQYEPQLIDLKSLQASGNIVNEKQINKLEKEVSKIKTVMNMLEDDQIHLSIQNLKMYFGGVKAVNDLTFDVKKGEVFGLIGPNGAGKTTVFNCITQFYKATSGNMILRNKENHIVDLYDYKTHDMISEGIARSFQNIELIWELTVLDNLMVAAHSLLITSFFDHMAHTQKLLREDKVIRTKGYQILQNLGIEEYAFRSPYGLPYGVLKKVELARTLMTDPSLIILDEPAAGLNDAETQDLAKVIKKINKEYGVTIFLVEHDMGLVMSICDRICAISFGKRIGLGTPKEIQQNPDVRKAYLGDDDDE